MTISELHAKAGYTPTQQAAIRSASPAVWRHLETLRNQAGTPAKLSVYQKAIERALGSLQNSQPLEGEELATACSSFFAWYGSEQVARGVTAHEVARGHCLEAWMAKWQPDVYERYRAAFNALQENATPERFKYLRLAAKALVEAFVATSIVFVM